MRRPGVVAAGLVLVLVLALGATACSDDGGGRGGGRIDGIASRAELVERCAQDRFGCVEYGVGEPVELGALLWVDPRADSFGVDSQRGIELAIDYLDGRFDGVAGTLEGHPVQLVVEDDGCDPEQGRAGAQRLAAQAGILAVVGTTCSSSALGAADEVLSEQGVVLISPSNTAPALTAPFERQRFYARTAANDEIQGAVVADLVTTSLRARRAAVVHDPGPYSAALADVFSRRLAYLGGEVPAVAEVDLDASAAELAPVMAELGTTAPEVLYFPTVEPLCEQALLAARAEPTLAGTRLVTSDACLSSELLAAQPEAVAGVLAAGPDQGSLLEDPFYADQFLPAYVQRFGVDPTALYHANAFDAANLVFDAFRRTVEIGPGGAMAVPRTAFRDALLDTDGYRGLSGVLACRPTGDCAQAARIAVYEAPAWPVDGGTPDPSPVFSQHKTLEEVERGG